jgi:hypothetical protein
VQGENAKCLTGISGIRGDTVAVLAAIFDGPLERVTCENEHAPIMLAFIIEFVVSRHHAHGAPAQPGVEFKKVSRHLHATTLERGAKLIIQRDDLGPTIHESVYRCGGGAATVGMGNGEQQGRTVSSDETISIFVSMPATAERYLAAAKMGRNGNLKD